MMYNKSYTENITLAHVNNIQHSAREERTCRDLEED